MKHPWNWTDKPVTWGAYLKMAGIVSVIGSVISAIYAVVIMDPVWWQTAKNFVKRLFKR